MRSSIQRIRRTTVKLFAATMIGVAAFGVSAAPAQARPAHSSDVHPTIVGGGVVSSNLPWIAALHSNGGFTCTSSQISRDWIITAAHCVPNDSGYSVRIGSLTRSSGGTVRDVAQVVRHPEFNWPAHDIALLRLAQPYDNSSYVRLATTADVQQGQAVTLYGWGSENADWSGPLPENLKYANGSLSSASCSSDVAPLICTQTDGSVAGGDSGGPVMILSPATGTYVHGGVCAVGHKPAGSGWAAYTSDATHRSWISSVSGV
jgi:secreted trypsin-like serine protease